MSLSACELRILAASVLPVEPARSLKPTCLSSAMPKLALKLLVFCCACAGNLTLIGQRQTPRKTLANCLHSSAGAQVHCASFCRRFGSPH